MVNIYIFDILLCGFAFNIYDNIKNFQLYVICCKIEIYVINVKVSKKY